MSDLTPETRALGALRAALACAAPEGRETMLATLASLNDTNNRAGRDGLDPHDLTERIDMTNPAQPYAVAVGVSVLWWRAETTVERHRDISRIADTGVAVNPTVEEFADVLAALLRGERPVILSPTLTSAINRIKALPHTRLLDDAAAQAEPYGVLLGALMGALYGDTLVPHGLLGDDDATVRGSVRALIEIGRDGESGSTARLLDPMELQPASPDYGRSMSMDERDARTTALAHDTLSPYGFQKPDMPRTMIPAEYAAWVAAGKPGAITGDTDDDDDDDGQEILHLDA